MSETPLNPRWERIGAPLKYDVVMFERLNIRIPGDMMRKIETIAGGRAKSVVIRELLAVALERYEHGV